MTNIPLSRLYAITVAIALRRGFYESQKTPLTDSEQNFIVSTEGYRGYLEDLDATGSYGQVVSLFDDYVEKGRRLDRLDIPHDTLITVAEILQYDTLREKLLDNVEQLRTTLQRRRTKPPGRRPV